MFNMIFCFLAVAIACLFANDLTLAWLWVERVLKCRIMHILSSHCTLVERSWGLLASVVLAVRIDKPRFGGVWSLLVVGGWDEGAAFWFLTPAQYTTLKSNLGSSKRQRACLTELSVRLRVYFNNLWPVRTENRVLRQNDLSRKTDNPITGHTRCVVSYLRAASAIERDQYPVDLDVSSGVFVVACSQLGYCMRWCMMLQF